MRKVELTPPDGLRLLLQERVADENDTMHNVASLHWSLDFAEMPDRFVTANRVYTETGPPSPLTNRHFPLRPPSPNLLDENSPWSLQGPLFPRYGLSVRPTRPKGNPSELKRDASSHARRQPRFTVLPLFHGLHHGRFRCCCADWLIRTDTPNNFTSRTARRYIDFSDLALPLRPPTFVEQYWWIFLVIFIPMSALL